MINFNEKNRFFLSLSFIVECDHNMNTFLFLISGGGHSAFLQKRLAKGQKYFDSGDYNMAKQKGPGGRPGMGRLAIPVLAGGGPAPPTGDTIPTPDNVPARKTSIIQPLHDHSQSMHLASDPAHAPPPPPPGQPMPNPAITKLAS